MQVDLSAECQSLPAFALLKFEMKEGEESMAKWVYTFEEGSADMRNLLGGKGANLAEMTNLGLPIPQGFTVTTEACTRSEERRVGKECTG